MDNCNGLGRLEAGAARRGSLNHQRTRWIPPILRWLLLLQLAISGVAKAARFELVSVPAATPTTSNDTPASARCQTQLNESFGRLPLMYTSRP